MTNVRRWKTWPRCPWCQPAIKSSRGNLCRPARWQTEKRSSMKRPRQHDVLKACHDLQPMAFCKEGSSIMMYVGVIETHTARWLVGNFICYYKVVKRKKIQGGSSWFAALLNLWYTSHWLEKVYLFFYQGYKNLKKFSSVELLIIFWLTANVLTHIILLFQSSILHCLLLINNNEVLFTDRTPALHSCISVCSPG